MRAVTWVMSEGVCRQPFRKELALKQACLDVVGIRGAFDFFKIGALS